MGLTIPIVIEREGREERAYDLYSRLLKDRIVLLGTEIDDNVANLVIAELLYLESQDPKKDIYMYINSPGGNVTSGLAIYDTMNYVKPDVVTICVGQASSMAAVLLAAGAKGKRFSLPHSRIMIHQPMGGFHGQATDIDIHAKEIMRLKDMIVRILAKHTGRSQKQIQKDIERDYFMSPEEAKAYGIIDEIITERG